MGATVIAVLILAVVVFIGGAIVGGAWVWSLLHDEPASPPERY